MAPNERDRVPPGPAPGGDPSPPAAPVAAEPIAADDAASVPESVRQRLEAWVPELVKKAVSAGVGAVFTTEEGIRRLAKDMPLPKDVAGYLVNTASSTKDDLMRVVAREVREFLTSVNLSEEIAKMLTTLSFEVKTEIRFIPNDQKYAGVEPDVKARVTLKRAEVRGPRRRGFRRGGGDDPAGGGGVE
jgi:hypothetical protein